MLFLADENCDYRLVKALRDTGFQVKAICEEHRGMKDDLVIELAERENRILITEDKDFGELVFVHSRASVGVLFLRFPENCRNQMIKTFPEMVKQLKDKLSNHFVTIQPGKVRILKFPAL